MAYYTPTDPRNALLRPVGVSVAALALFVSATTVIAGVVLNLIGMSSFADGLSLTPPQGYTPQQAAQAARALVIGSTIISGLIATLLLVCGLLVLRRNNAMRIVTFIVAGIGMLCYGCGFLFVIGGVRATERSLLRPPIWYGPLTISLEVINVLALMLAIILLALPSSAAYFRKAVPGTMPVAAPGYGYASPYAMPAYPPPPPYYEPVPAQYTPPTRQYAPNPYPPAVPWTVPVVPVVDPYAPGPSATSGAEPDDDR